MVENTLFSHGIQEVDDRRPTDGLSTVEPLIHMRVDRSGCEALPLTIPDEAESFLLIFPEDLGQTRSTGI